MSIYDNAYDILSDVREGLNEYSTALVQGTATHGKFSNTYILKKINRAQRLIYAKLFRRIKGHFLASYSAALVDSVFTLPWDFGQVIRFEDENDCKVYPVDVNKRPTYGGTGSDNLYYREGNTYTLTKSGITETYTLWYYKKPREITMGAASADNTLASTAKALADYYNNLTIEDVTSGWAGTISDYSAARVVTVSGQTLTSGDYYGIVSDLPEPFHHLIASLAVILCKAEHPVSPAKPTKSETDIWRTEFDDAIEAFGHVQGDVPVEDIFTDFGGAGGVEINIPGQGYSILD